jgi:hypothetical protein
LGGLKTVPEDPRSPGGFLDEILRVETNRGERGREEPPGPGAFPGLFPPGLVNITGVKVGTDQLRIPAQASPPFLETVGEPGFPGPTVPDPFPRPEVPFLGFFRPGGGGGGQPSEGGKWLKRGERRYKQADILDLVFGIKAPDLEDEGV